MRSLTRAAAATALAVAISLPTLSSANQAAADPAIDRSGTTQIAWKQLGLTDRVQLVGSNQPSDISVPVPAGVAPGRVTGQIGSVVSMSSGRVDVFDTDGALLGTIPLPSGPASMPFSVDTATAKVTGGVAKVSFVLHDDDPPTTFCSQPPSLILSQLAMTYSGEAPNPRTVADFLPGYLNDVTIRVGPSPTEDQQQTALTLVAELTHLYRPIPVRIDVDTSSGPARPAGAASRVIELRDGGEAGIRVENGGTPAAVLVISGQGQDLRKQAALFTDRRVTLAQTPSAAVASVSDAVTQAADTLTFAQLDISGEASVLGTTTLYAGLDGSAFGLGSLQHAKVRLKAQYTPVVSGEGSVLVRSGGTILASRALDESGVIDFEFDVPAESITSSIGLGLELRYIPNRDCAPLTDRMTFALDPTSTVSVTPGSDNRGGFPVLPTAFSPDFDVSVDSADQVRYVATLINLLGQQSAVPMRPNLTSFSEAAHAATGLLTVTTGEQLTRAGMRPAIKPGDSATIDGDPLTEVNLGGPLAVVQAFSHNGRIVLAVDAAANGELIQRTLDYIRGLESRWSTLTGDVVATGSAGTTVNLTVRSGGWMAHQVTPGAGWKWWTWATIAIALVAAIVVLGLLILRRRRRS